jgi:transposase-like protein
LSVVRVDDGTSCPELEIDWSRPGFGGKTKGRILSVSWSTSDRPLPERPPEECAVGEHIGKYGRLHEGRPEALGALIHEAVRRVIEVAVEEELTAALGAARYARDCGRGGYRNGRRPRTLTGPTGPLALTLPRATLFMPTGMREWTSALVPRYQRRLREVNEAVVATYLAGGNTRRLRGALAPLLKAAPLSKSAVSRVVGTLKIELEAWRTRSLAELPSRWPHR